MSVNSKKKGNFWENRWSDWLNNHGIKAWKDGQSGGGNRVKSDVDNNIDIHFEMKAGKQVPKKIYDFYDQATKDAEKTHNTPYVITHRDGRPKEEFLVIMNCYDWLDLYRGENEVGDIDKNDKWVIKKAIDILKQVLKLLEKYI